MGTSRQRCAYAWWCRETAHFHQPHAPPGWPYRGIRCHIEKALKDEFLILKLTISGGCFCCVVPRLYPCHKKGEVWHSSGLSGQCRLFHLNMNLPRVIFQIRLHWTVGSCNCQISASFCSTSTHFQFLFGMRSIFFSSHTRWCSIVIRDGIIDPWTGCEVTGAEEVVFYW